MKYTSEERKTVLGSWLALQLFHDSRCAILQDAFLICQVWGLVESRVDSCPLACACPAVGVVWVPARWPLHCTLLYYAKKLNENSVKSLRLILSLAKIGQLFLIFIYFLVYVLSFHHALFIYYLFIHFYVFLLLVAFKSFFSLCVPFVVPARAS